MIRSSADRIREHVYPPETGDQLALYPMAAVIPTCKQRIAEIVAPVNSIADTQQLWQSYCC